MFDEYTEADYAADRALGQLDAWENAHPGNYDPLETLIAAMEADLLLQESLAA